MLLTTYRPPRYRRADPAGWRLSQYRRTAASIANTVGYRGINRQLALPMA